MFNKITLIGRVGQNAEAKTAHNQREYVLLNVTTQQSWKNSKGEYETRTEWHSVFAWKNPLSTLLVSCRGLVATAFKSLCQARKNSVGRHRQKLEHILQPSTIYYGDSPMRKQCQVLANPLNPIAVDVSAQEHRQGKIKAIF